MQDEQPARNGELPKDVTEELDSLIDGVMNGGYDTNGMYTSELDVKEAVYDAYRLGVARSETEALLKLLEAACCPNCDGSGSIVHTVAACCGRPTRSGECCGDPVPEQEQEQCQWCFERAAAISRSPQTAVPK